jgi:uncharacterized protein
MPFAFPVPLKDVRLQDPFLDRYARLVREKVIPYQWQALNDQVPGAEKSHAVENFRIAAGIAQGSFHGYVFQDSDLYKWLEAVAYRLCSDPDPTLEATADEAIELVASAQSADGYLNTYYTVAEPGQRWTDERRRHELYCAGHLMEAAVAYAEATGKGLLLDVARRLADHIGTVFGPGRKEGYPGHPGIELALIKLSRATGEHRYVELASYFIDERGKQPHFYDLEAQARGAKNLEDYYGSYVYEYTQAHMPVREQQEAVGHAVRAVYLYSGMADVALETGDESLATACRTLWRNLTECRMYITGGIGSQEFGEDFTSDYDLPNDTMYAETCAAIGLIFFAQRMLTLEPKGDYGDVLERALYNGVLSGISLEGDRFFYVNPLEVRPDACARRHDLKHVAPVRQPWFGCACCPPNLARLVASLGRYIYATSEEGLWVHLYAGSTLETTCAGTCVKLLQRTDYPKGEMIRLDMEPEAPVSFALGLRIPGWCRVPRLRLNGEDLELGPLLRDGYAYVKRTWSPGDRIELTLPMPVERVWAHHRVAADAGLVALQRGPIVYCLEEADHGRELGGLALQRHVALESRFDPGLLGGTTVIEGTALRQSGNALLYAMEPPREKPVPIRAVPYALWGNRGSGEMRVWVRERP